MKDKLDKSVSRGNYRMLRFKKNLQISKQELKVSKLEKTISTTKRKIEALIYNLQHVGDFFLLRILL
jgi:hypothetical protein